MTGPTVRARQLGIGLARLRKDAGVTQREAAATIECSQAKMAQLEAGRGPVRRPELIVLLQHYRVDQTVIDQMDELRLEASKRGWWATYGLPDWLADYVGLENDATRVRSFELELIPGLLQVESYIREVHVLRGNGLSAQAIDTRVTTRLQRQARLSATVNPLKLSAVVSQSALQRCIAQPDSVSAAALRHLRDRAQLANVQLRILPFEFGRHSGMSGAFTLLDFPHGLLPPIAWQEYAMGGHIVDDSPVVEGLGKLYDAVCNQALTEDESLALIVDLIGSIH